LSRVWKERGALFALVRLASGLERAGCTLCPRSLASGLERAGGTLCPRSSSLSQLRGSSLPHCDMLQLRGSFLPHCSEVPKSGVHSLPSFVLPRVWKERGALSALVRPRYHNLGGALSPTVIYCNLGGAFSPTAVRFQRAGCTLCPRSSSLDGEDWGF
jgi:hypothetical protein